MSLPWRDPTRHAAPRSIDAFRRGSSDPRCLLVGLAALLAAFAWLTFVAPTHRLYAQNSGAVQATNATPMPGYRPRLAGLTTVYFPNSHAELFFGRPLRGMAMDDRPPFPRAELASLFIEQFPANDVGRALAAKRRVPIYATAREALCLGGKQLAVDGVLLIAEHGRYPESDTGQFQFPKRPFFTAITEACAQSGKRVPVFVDKHLADTWTDARWIYDEARRLDLPLMAGSTLPIAWRYPPRDTRRGQKLREIVALSYHRLDSYGIHALEIIQALAERRAGGETGVRRVRTLKGAAAWRAIETREVDPELVDLAVRTSKDRPVPRNKRLPELVPDATLMIVDYEDGLRASVLSLGQLYIEWSAAWRADDGGTESAVFWTQEARPFHHFTLLWEQLDTFFATGQPPWPVERTLLTTGMLDALLISARDGGRVVETPHLRIAYHSAWNWRQPPPPPPGRPLDSP